MVKWTNLERVWSSWNTFQLSSLKMLNFLSTFDKQFCGSTKAGDYYDKGHVKIILLPVIALSYPHFCPKLEQTLHIHQGQHS